MFLIVGFLMLGENCGRPMVYKQVWPARAESCPAFVKAARKAWPKDIARGDIIVLPYPGDAELMMKCQDLVRECKEGPNV